MMPDALMVDLSKIAIENHNLLELRNHRIISLGRGNHGRSGYRVMFSAKERALP